MDQTRVQAILNTSETIYVTYQNLPVWIDQLHPDGEATIRDLNSAVHLKVPVQQLAEVNEIPSEAQQTTDYIPL